MIRLKIWNSKIALGDFVGLLGALIIISSLILAHRTIRTSETTGKPALAGQELMTVPSQKNDPESQNGVTNPASRSVSLATPGLVSPPASTPATVLDLANWKLTLPVETSRSGNPDEIKQPELGWFTQSPHFELNNQKNGVIFRANVEGATTKGSSYPRSELREMTDSGKQLASWSSFSGTHTMFIKQAITHLPVVKSEVVAGQIHDASDDVIMIRLNGKRLFVEGSRQVIGELDPTYNLGTTFSVKIVASDGRIKVYYNDVQKVDYVKSGQGYYFKAGCYSLSNLSKGDQAGAYGEVVIYDLQVSHY